MGQLRRQDRGLDRVEPGVDPDAGADIAVAPAVFADLAQRGRQRRVVCRGHAGIAERAEVLRRIEAEAGDVADAAGRPAAIERAVALRAILDDPQARAAARAA